MSKDLCADCAKELNNTIYAFKSCCANVRIIYNGNIVFILFGCYCNLKKIKHIPL